ncbi:MAG: methylmalonyl-CoA mutase family protein, partial [Myxococcota bacterium]
KYMVDLLREKGSKARIFGGGGGTILPEEIDALHAHGVAKLFSPDDGRSLGLQGMINQVLEGCDFATTSPAELEDLLARMTATDPLALGRLITLAENHGDVVGPQLRAAAKTDATVPVLGITGTGGAGKSSLVDELVRRFLRDQPDKRLAVLSIDPSRRRSGGALLGDRIRMNAIDHPRVFMRSLATRQANLALSAHVQDAIDVCRTAGFDLVIVETSGIGQSDTAITDHADVCLYVMTAEYGAATQLEKIDMLDFADVVAINKFDKRGSLDALRDVRKQMQRNRGAFHADPATMPAFGTIASQFGDPGTDALYRRLMETIHERTGVLAPNLVPADGESEKRFIVPPERTRYLAEIVEESRRYDHEVEAEVRLARRAFQLAGAITALRGDEGDLAPLADPGSRPDDAPEVATLRKRYDGILDRLSARSKTLLREWPDVRARYAGDEYAYEVRGKTFRQPLTRKTLSGNTVRRVSLPKDADWGAILNWRLRENLPGEFPFAAGVFPLKREGEAPARMFAGEGGPERTNRRFHYVSRGMPAKRLSTAFDSVTLYGEDPDPRPDIYGKIGNSGVSVATLDDAKKLYSGFDLCDPATSVSMTINGPAPMLLGFFMNAAVDQQCEKYLRAEGKADEIDARIDALYAERGVPRPRYQGELPEGNDGLGLLLLGVTGDEVLPAETYARIKAETLKAVRGTVQADILKEDQAQNTCIFSTEFALRMMGDIQAYFIEHAVTRFYSVSISGYHIAEAGANPISQLAFTLANGFTFVEYYLSRGMKIDDFAPNFSFFFSNGTDPEYAVIGRVARRIWAKAIARKYGGNARSQKLKYHIQTSGRSLHAQEIAFNDIRTTLQALYAIYDNCNSLHTNAYDEAITTPTEESVRRALAIQLIINEELGLAKNENPLQGAFIIDELTDLVEEA